MNVERPTLPSLQVLLEGRDACCVAQTGSGKTMAFLLPSFERILRAVRRRDGKSRRPAEPVCVVLAPTRELAVQIDQEANRFGGPQACTHIPLHRSTTAPQHRNTIKLRRPYLTSSCLTGPPLCLRLRWGVEMGADQVHRGGEP
jgi:Lhr-like helicase